MDDIADAIIDGELCQWCGCPIEEPLGYPGYCSEACRKEHGVEADTMMVDDDGRVQCPTCYKWLKNEMGMKQHRRDKHGWD